MEDGIGQTFGDFVVYLEEALTTPTGWLWVECVIKPTFIAHLFIGADREGY